MRGVVKLLLSIFVIYIMFLSWNRFIDIIGSEIVWIKVYSLHEEFSYYLETFKGLITIIFFCILFVLWSLFWIVFLIFWVFNERGDVQED